MFHSVELRAHCHATEEESRVGKALRTVCPDGTIETEPAEGHHGNPILLMRCRIQKDDVIGAFWRRVKVAGLLDRILETLDERIDEDAVLHIRVDTQKAFAGAIELPPGAEAIAVRGKIAAPPAKKARPGPIAPADL